MKAQDINKVACIGAGVIGSSWAIAFAMKGLEVNVYDIKDEALKLAEERVNTDLAVLIANEVLDESGKQEILIRIKYTTSLAEAVKDVQFVQESGPENYEIKQSMIEEMEKYLSAEAIIASSTSGLLITKICEKAQHPERFVGAHPYNPPHLIPLVEITKGEKTSEENVSLAKEFYQLLGKEPVVLNKEAPGFICNRIQMAVYREVCELVMRGVCSIEDADKAVTFGPGIRWGIMGPSLVFELGGGQHGVAGLMSALNDSITSWLQDMADWKEFPKEFAEIAEKGVQEELQNRSSEAGNDRESLAAYRDKMLIEILRLHKKL